MRLPENTNPQLFLNVYSASAEESGFSGILGLIGVYHSGVEINGVEYAFAGVTGVYECRPGDYGTILKRIHIGISQLTNRQLDALIFGLRHQFPGDEYHIVLKNCNHFSDSLIKTATGNGIPAWINRASWFASWCRCLISNNQSDGSSPIRPSDTTFLLRANRSVNFQGQGIRLSDNDNQQSITLEEQRMIRLRNLDRQ